jgi:hypothetical protein
MVYNPGMRKSASTIQTRTRGRTDSCYSVRNRCAICKVDVEQGEKYRWDTRTSRTPYMISWHVDCEAANPARYQKCLDYLERHVGGPPVPASDLKLDLTRPDSAGSHQNTKTVG